MNNCYSLECFLTGVNTDPASSSFFKYISITKSKSAVAFICMTSYSNFENIYFQNVSCLRNIYFYTQYTVDINNCYSDVYFMAVGNCSMKNVLFNFTNTIPISGYYEEAILDYLLKESVTDTNKYASKPLTIKDLKGEIIIDTVIFENISSTNNGEAVSICCFSSNILITNCMFDQCTSNSFTQETSGGAIYIVGHNTYSNLRNVLSTNCQAGRCHFCYIYSNYLTSLTRTTVCKCAPDNYISDPDTLYIFYDNFFESCNISNNYMGLYLIYSFEDINFTDCVIASNTLVQGQCYIVGIEIKLDKCIIYNNTYHGPGNVTFSTFLIFNIEFNDCYLMVEDEFNPSNFTVINCTINNMTLEFINNLAISRQVGCNPKTIHIAESKFPAYKIIILGIIGLLVIALISIIVIISQHRTYKRLEERNNISNVIMNDFG